MAIEYRREKIGEGINFNTIINKRQKTNTLLINLITGLSKETAPDNAIIPYILSNSNETHPTLTELSRELQALYGASIKGTVTKAGDSQVMTLIAGCINDRYTLEKEKITGRLAEILIECLTSPNSEGERFYEKDFILKKQELIDDIQAEINDKRSYAFKRAGLNIYRGEPAAVSVKGDMNTAKLITGASSYGKYKKLLGEAQCEITFVGAEGSENIKSMFKNAFSQIARNYAGDNSSELSAPKKEVLRVTETLEIAQSKMVIGLKTDCKNAPAMKLMNAVFGATPFSKLFMNVREKYSLCYYCSSGINDKKGVVYIDSGVERENIKKTEEEIINQLNAVREGAFTDEEITNARLALINTLRGVNDSARSIADWYFQQNYRKTSFSPEDEIERLNAVTKEDITAAAQSLILDTVYVLTHK